MTIINFILHIDHHLIEIVNQFGNWTYLIIFAIIFIETGLVIFPFLPGDSLIFAASSLAVNPEYNLNIWWIYFAVLLAAILGDACNYEIGAWSVRQGTKHTWFNRLINQKIVWPLKTFLTDTGQSPLLLADSFPLLGHLFPLSLVAAICIMANLHFIM